MSKCFAEMQEMYGQIVERCNKIELQDWKAEGAMIELFIAQVMRLRYRKKIWSNAFRACVRWLFIYDVFGI